MNLSVLNKSFKEREPILKEELYGILMIKNEKTLNQTIYNLVSFGIINQFMNGVYYIPNRNSKFSNLKPSIADVLYKKYIKGFRGIRTGAYLLYKHKFTSQVSDYYEILSNNVSINTRAKKVINEKTIVSYPKFEINESNVPYIEFLELIRNLNYSDFSIKDNIVKLREIYINSEMNKEKLLYYSKYYKGKRLKKISDLLGEVINDDITSWSRII